MDFTVYPAIDIKGGQCVRLFQGDYALESIYYQDPLQAAKKWIEEGTDWLHLVDLDGAKSGRPVNFETIKKICKSIGVKIQLGGGIRNIETVRAYLEMGVERVILGSISLNNPCLTKSILEEFGPEKIIVSLDGKKNKALKEGWLEQSEKTLAETILYLKEIGVKTFIYTDVDKDGTLKGPNIDQALFLAQESSQNIIIAGGISSNNDVLRLTAFKDKGIEGVVIGRALYTGDVNLKKLLFQLKGGKNLGG